MNESADFHPARNAAAANFLPLSAFRLPPFTPPLVVARVEGHGVRDAAHFEFLHDRAVALENGHDFAAFAAHHRPFERGRFGERAEREAVGRAEKCAFRVEADLHVEVVHGVLEKRVGDEADADFLLGFESLRAGEFVGHGGEGVARRDGFREHGFPSRDGRAVLWRSRFEREAADALEAGLFLDEENEVAGARGEDAHGRGLGGVDGEAALKFAGAAELFHLGALGRLVDDPHAVVAPEAGVERLHEIGQGERARFAFLDDGDFALGDDGARRLLRGFVHGLVAHGERGDLRVERDFAGEFPGLVRAHELPFSVRTFRPQREPFAPAQLYREHAAQARRVVGDHPLIAVVGFARDIQFTDREAARGVGSGGCGLAGVVLAVPVGDEAVETDEEVLLRGLPREHADELPLFVVDAEAQRALHRRREKGDADAAFFGRRWWLVFLGKGGRDQQENAKE